MKEIFKVISKAITINHPVQPSTPTLEQQEDDDVEFRKYRPTGFLGRADYVLHHYAMLIFPYHVNKELEKAKSRVDDKYFNPPTGYFLGEEVS